MDWCPSLRPLNYPVFLRADGTFGMDDPVCWARFYDPGAPHLPCIPLFNLNPQSPTHIFHRGLYKEHVNFTDFWLDGLRVATPSDNLTRDLKSAISHMDKRAASFLSTTDEPHPRLKSLIHSLKVSGNKLMGSEAPLRELRIIFGLTSRFYLESQGYIDYHIKYLPRLTSTGHPTVDTGVIGVWTMDEATATRYLKMGIPVWLLRYSSLVPHSPDHIGRHVNPKTYSERIQHTGGRFWDTTRAAGCPDVFPERQIDTSVLTKELDSWVAKGLMEGL